MGSNKISAEQHALGELNLKRCGLCGEISHADCYNKAVKNWMRLSYSCRPCRAKTMRERRAASSPEAKKARSQASIDWRKRNPERHAETVQNYRRTSEKFRDKQRRRGKRILSTVKGNLSNRMRTSIHCALRGKRYGKRTFEICGYTVNDLKVHLERQFTKGMGWHNMGEWHIDHIVPLASFEMTGADDPVVKIAWGLPNLRPLWAKENIKKNDSRDFLC